MSTLVLHLDDRLKRQLDSLAARNHKPLPDWAAEQLGRLAAHANEIANPPKPNKRMLDAAKLAASSVTIADWTLEPPANTQLLADPLPTPIGAKAPILVPAPQHSLHTANHRPEKP